MDATDTYRVIRLCVENYKRLKAADVTPGRNAVIVSGKNKVGKTSLLDSIAAALGGKRQTATQPLRTGAESGQILCVIGEGDPAKQLLVKMTFTAEGKRQLEITNAQGYKAPSPQAILDSLCGAIAFDPLSFTRMDDKEQLETLRRIVGLDFTDLDAERKSLYAERADANKAAKNLAAQAEGVVVPEGTPETELSVADLMGEVKQRQEHNHKNQVERDKIGVLDRDIVTAKQAVSIAEKNLAKMRAELAQAESYLGARGQDLVRAELLRDAQAATIKVLEDADVDGVQAQIVSAQTVNQNVGKVKRKTQLLAEQQEAQAESKRLTAQIEAIDGNKEKQLAEVKWPIDNLSFGEDGVLYNGLPFSQASGAEQLAISFAMSAALHPQLKVALIRDASLLDEDQMKVVCGLAEKYDTQCWLEVVDEAAGPSGILIEDGTVVQSGSPAEAAPAEKPKRKRKAAEPDESPADRAPFDEDQSELPF